MQRQIIMGQKRIRVFFSYFAEASRVLTYNRQTRFNDLVLER